MLSTMRNSWVLFAILAIVALSSAMSIEDALHLDGIEAYLHNGAKRQATGTGGNSQPSSAAPTSDTPQSSEAPKSTPAPASSEAPSSSDQPTPAPSSEAPSSNAPSQNTPKPTPTPTPTPSQNQASQKPSSKTPVVLTSVGLATSVHLFTTVQTIISNGQTLAQTQTGAATEVLTTAVSVSTDPASLNNSGGNGNGGSGGLSSENKKVIGGVVGGVGGAILLGGLAIVCWRIWGRKKHVGDDDDDLMAGTGSALGDKPHSPGSGSTPFQANLEQYHNPGGRPNAGTNF